MPDTRPVWLTREQRDEIDIQGFEPEVVALWDAAPAGAAEAVRRALTQVIVQGDTGRMALSVTDDEALAVLRALGMPEADA